MSRKARILRRVALGLPEFFVRFAPYSLVVSATCFLLHLAITSRLHGFSVGLVSTLGLLTGVQAPCNSPCGLLNLLAWLVVVAGWLFLPTTIGLILAAAEKRIDVDEDLEIKLRQLARQLGLKGDVQNAFVRNVMEGRDTGWVKP